MRFGHFDLEHKEYVITNPRTPVKWINYIGTRDFGGFVDHTGGALICREDPAFNRITKYIQQMPSSDLKGETLYLRIHTNNGYIIYSPFFVPTLQELDRFECHIGLGYTRIISRVYGLESIVTIFVPQGGYCEIRDIQIKNVSDRSLEVDVIPLVEYTHPNALGQFTNADWIPQTMQSEALNQQDGSMLLLQYPFMNKGRKVNYFTSNHPASSFETDRKKFLGANEYGSFRDPLSLQAPELSNSVALRGDNIAALMHHLGKLEPGEKKQIITQLGQAENLTDIEKSITVNSQPDHIKKEFAAISQFWQRYLETFTVETPDAAMNAMINLYNPRQCFTTFTWSRYLSYYQVGLGARGIGIRDSSQDLLAVLAALPEESRCFLERLLSFQKVDGSSMHQFNPLTSLGSCGDSMEMEDRYHYYSDDHLWLVLVTIAYLKESGNLEFLQKTIPYYEKDRDEKPLEQGTVLDHIKRAITFTNQNVGSHGIPLLGFADWNDTVNLPKGAESFFTANLFGLALKELFPILRAAGELSLLTTFEEMYQEMQHRVENCGWDGAWYLRYFDHEGKAMGSHENKYCQIYLNGQSWAVLSGFASNERARTAMASVFEKLFTTCGLKISTPSFNGYDPIYGGITTYRPGTKENGGIFVHPNPWAMIAETLLGNGERAYQYYYATNPALCNENSDVYECEPYVYAQNVLSDEHPQFGLARNSWLTGAAAWHYIAATQYILGISPAIEGLYIDPCIPSAWDGFTATRNFRGKTIHIQVHNPAHVCKGVHSLHLDGKKINGNLLCIEDIKSDSYVEVWLEKED